MVRPRQQECPHSGRRWTTCWDQSCRGPEIAETGLWRTRSRLLAGLFPEKRPKYLLVLGYCDSKGVVCSRTRRYWQGSCPAFLQLVQGCPLPSSPLHRIFLLRQRPHCRFGQFCSLDYASGSNAPQLQSSCAELKRHLPASPCRCHCSCYSAVRGLESWSLCAPGKLEDKGLFHAWDIVVRLSSGEKQVRPSLRWLQKKRSGKKVYMKRWQCKRLIQLTGPAFAAGLYTTGKKTSNETA